jgi:proteasome lid subunit RPN8/RPN11
MACVIAAPVVESIRTHAAAEYPKESCGLLVGRDLPDGRIVTRAVAAGNVDAAAERRFTIAPEDFLAADRAARAAGLEVVGFYHSHPDAEARPSPSDLAEAWRHYSYLIVAVRDGRALEQRCWRLGNGAFVEEPLAVGDAGAGEPR